MLISDVVGLLACTLVLASFCSGNFIRLRLIALTSNVAFVTYGSMLGLLPILCLHTILLGVNVYHLYRLLPAWWSSRQNARKRPVSPELHNRV